MIVDVEQPVSITFELLKALAKHKKVNEVYFDANNDFYFYKQEINNRFYGHSNFFGSNQFYAVADHEIVKTLKRDQIFREVSSSMEKNINKIKQLLSD